MNLPYPDQPANGDDFDADPVRANLQAIADYLSSLPGGALQAKSVLEAAFDDSINPRLRYSEGFSNFVVSGGLPGGFSGLSLTVPSGTAYTSGYRHPINGQLYTLAINSDTYFSVNKNSSIDTPQAVANGASQPTLPTDSQWLFKAISNGTAITSIVDLRALGAVQPLNIHNPYKFSAYQNAALSPTGVVAFDTKEFDTGSNYDTSTGKFTAPVSGYYKFSSQLRFLATNSSQNLEIKLLKNGSIYKNGDMSVNMYVGTTGVAAVSVEPPTMFLAAGDYIQVSVVNSPTLALAHDGAGTDNYFGGHMVSRS